ncbi:MAG: hypothetical protein A4E23_00108 [Methanomethylovorans sp. PtaU1.Bin073]|nr:MAG: hypothetical protein A4E23_00108 [Methanomethylovorans sp. PtaU1.Bin073]
MVETIDINLLEVTCSNEFCILCTGGLIHISQILYLHAFNEVHDKNALPAILSMYHWNYDIFIILEIVIESHHIPGFYSVVQLGGKYFSKFFQEGIHIKITADANNFHNKGFHVLDYIKVKVYGIYKTRTGNFHRYFLTVQYSFIYLSYRCASYGRSIKFIKNVY